MLHTFLISVLHGGKRLASSSSSLTLGKMDRRQSGTQS